MAAASDPAPERDLIYPLDVRPPVAESLFAAIQHVLSSFVGIITPTLIIGGVLGLEAEVPYLISMALLVSGVGTMIQARRPFGIGAGMICVQGTSFAFLSAVIAAGMTAKSRGGGPHEMLALIFTLCFLGAFVEVGLSFFIDRLQRIVTPIVTGIVITTIGVSLIATGMNDLAGGVGAADYAAPVNLLLGLTVLVVIVALNRAANAWLRLSAIVVGLVTGCALAAAFGRLDLGSATALPLVSLPIPFRYGFDFDWGAFVPFLLLYVITAIETSGDLTANCLISRQPIAGPGYISRIRGGLLGDGFNSALAAMFNTFPNTTFSQNNGVIQLTGTASRHVGLYIGALLALLGLFPVIGGLLQAIPKPVLGGATLVMFGTVAAAGVKILATLQLDRRNMLIMAVSFGVGLGVSMVPQALAQLPELLRNVFGSAVTTAGLAAIALDLFLPASADTTETLLGNAVPESTGLSSSE